MKKMPTLFKREFTPDHKVIIHNEVTPGCDWVLRKDYLIKHGSIHLYHCGRTFEAIRDFLERNEQIEGIVFHRENGQMCKIKRTDFGFSWKNSKK